MQFFSFWRSLAGFRVRIALNLKQVPAEAVFVDIDADAHRADAYRKINPQMALPALVIDDGTVRALLSQGQSRIQRGLQRGEVRLAFGIQRHQLAIAGRRVDGARLMGEPAARYEARAKVTGQPLYAADIHGYTGLIERDEQGTLARLTRSLALIRSLTACSYPQMSFALRKVLLLKNLP